MNKETTIKKQLLSQRVKASKNIQTQFKEKPGGDCSYIKYDPAIPSTTPAGALKEMIRSLLKKQVSKELPHSLPSFETSYPNSPLEIDLSLTAFLAPFVYLDAINQAIHIKGHPLFKAQYSSRGFSLSWLVAILSKLPDCDLIILMFHNSTQKTWCYIPLRGQVEHLYPCPLHVAPGDLIYLWSTFITGSTSIPERFLAHMEGSS